MRRLPILLVTFALLAGTCARTAAPAATLTSTDAGSTKSLPVGARIEISLPPKGDATWDVYDYPHGSLRLETRDPASGRFVFVATAPGQGPVIALFGQPCGPDVVGANPSAPTDCIPKEPIDPVPGHLPAPTVFSVMIVVSG